MPWNSARATQFRETEISRRNAIDANYRCSLVIIIQDARGSDREILKKGREDGVDDASAKLDMYKVLEYLRRALER
jgi:hypothetical protein